MEVGDTVSFKVLPSDQKFVRRGIIKSFAANKEGVEFIRIYDPKKQFTYSVTMDKVKPYKRSKHGRNKV